MMSIPIWVFVILVILASITVLEILFVSVLMIVCLFQRDENDNEFEQSNVNCPEKLDPEYIDKNKQE